MYVFMYVRTHKEFQIQHTRPCYRVVTLNAFLQSRHDILSRQIPILYFPIQNRAMTWVFHLQNFSVAQQRRTRESSMGDGKGHG